MVESGELEGVIVEDVVDGSNTEGVTDGVRLMHVTRLGSTALMSLEAFCRPRR